MVQYNQNDTATVSTTKTLVKSISITVSESIQQHDALATAYNLTGSFGLGIAGAISYAYRPGAVVAETVRILGAATPNWKYGLTISEAARLHDALTPAVPVLISQGVGIAGAVTVAVGTIVAERLGLAAALGVKSTNAPVISEVIRLNPILSRAISGAVGEGVGLASSYVVTPTWAKTVSEGIGLAGSVSPYFLLRADVDESLSVDDELSLNWIFWNVAVNEGIKLSAAYIQNNTITTWAINTRTGAVSEYTNYGFNSFAKLGVNRFVAASAEGLYELDGPDDDGTNFITNVRSGFAQFGVTRLTSLSAAYLGIHGTGNFLFKIITGDGLVRVYQVKANSMNSTKVRVAKGIRTRYIAFELESVGQEFDLDTVEFVPIVAQRRV